MKNILFKAALALIVVATTIACTNDNTGGSSASYRSTFINSSEVGASVKGVMVKSFDKTTDQIVYSDSKSSFTISNMDCSNYFSLTLEGTFIVDYNVSVTCATAGVDGLENKTYTTTVVQSIDSEKTYWLWDSSSNTGFIVNFTL